MNALVRFALQAADGVRGLHQEGVIHRDLACRNLLVRCACMGLNGGWGRGNTACWMHDDKKRDTQAASYWVPITLLAQQQHTHYARAVPA